MASPGNQHCASCIGTLSFSVVKNADHSAAMRPSTQLLWLFLPRDATLARYMLSTCVRPSFRPFVGLSFASRCCMEKAGRIELGFGTDAFFHLSYTVLWLSNFRYLQKLGYLPGDFVPNSGLRKYCHGKSIALRTTLVVVVDGRACWRHLYDSRRVVAVYYKSINCNPLTPSLRFVVDLLYSLFLQWQDFYSHSASRGPSALAELLVYITRHLLSTSGDSKQGTSMDESCCGNGSESKLTV